MTAAYSMLLRVLPSYENNDIWRSGLMIGYVWVDEARATACAVVTGTDRNVAKAPTQPVILADSGNNPTGGGVGDRGDVLAVLIDRNWQDALLAGITDCGHHGSPCSSGLF